MGWSRRDVDIPVNTSAQNPILSKLQSLNPFGNSGYVSLPTQEPGAPLPAPSRREEDEGIFALSRWDRLLVFGACNVAALVCFVICFALLPILAVATRKFAILWSFGSVLFLASWAVLMGPWTYLLHLISTPRLPFTAAYFTSIALTLVFAIKLQSTFLTLISSILQLAALLWYLVSYFPMGGTGLRFAARVGTNRLSAWMSD